MPASPSSAALKKSDVLSRINSVLDASGLNDCVWSVRDCDSTLFVLIFKKLFGKLPGIVTSPVSPAEHARNFDVVLRAVATDVLDMDLTHISPDALARGDLQALFNLAEIFSELCEILLERNDDENVVRPATTSSGSAKRPASARPTGTKESAVPEPPAEDADGDEDEAWEQPVRPAAVAEAAANTENHEGLSIRISPQRKGKPVRDEVARLEGVRVEGATGRPRSAGRVRSSAAGDEVAAEAHASARAAICAAVANCGDLPAKRPASAARGTAASRTRAAPSARRPAAAPPRDANAAARAAAAKRAAEYAKALERGVPGYRPATAPGKMSRKQTEQAARLDALRQLEKKLLQQIRDGVAAPPAAELGANFDAPPPLYSRSDADAFAKRAAATYDAMARQQAARARRAAALEVARGAVTARNETRDNRIEKIRLRRIAMETVRAKQAREMARASKEDLTYRRLYRQGLQIAKEQLLLEEAAGEEAYQKLLQERRRRQAALERFFDDQRGMLAEQLQQEQQERSFRESAQRAVTARLEAEARAASTAALRGLHAQLGNMERDDDGVLVP